ncbi:hypothetical protein [Aliikangiella coralliicola]|uniref:Organic solvent tolerance-like N-terminal domain-containing protein n=1 Tax=Aliikangiella coralliicola TaxID=2592383 RepID=A0A545U4Q0_9GAMM|nr:hypothetical protein [Aliikangiella coralliicola]TQV84455.1 hypothetical protein FLL46_22830 [Aliikangiella coralliicola]
MFYRKLNSLLPLLLLAGTPAVEAAKYGKFQKIDLPSCHVNIKADRSHESDSGTVYTGNVRVLIGFASLRTDRVTLVKKKNGKCELISEFDS